MICQPNISFQLIGCGNATPYGSYKQQVRHAIMFAGSVLPHTDFAPGCDVTVALANAQTLLARNANSPFELQLWTRGATGREPVEDFIARAYAREFAASIAVHYPLLISVSDGIGGICAAVGVRMACDEALFLEQYLDRPVEATLRHVLDRHVGRDVIVELGSFASTGFNMSVYLLGAVSAYLSTRGFEVGLVTATDKLSRLFDIFDFPTQVICPAGREALRDQTEDWGTYYSRNPRVIAGSIGQCLAAVLKSVAVQSAPKRHAAMNCLLAQATVRP